MITKFTPFINQLVVISKKSLNFLTNKNGLGSTFFRNIAHKAGVKVKATNPEITIEITIVIANCWYIAPVKPPINETGTKIEHRTNTIAITGAVTSFIALIVASFTLISLFECKILSTFSITIIASSTTIPTARTNPNKVKRLIEYPNKYIPANVPIIDMGIAIIGIIVALIFCKKRYTIIITNKSASINVFITSFIEICINEVVS